jgi:EAL domain-containing protein (putative c-di-GMP-specific phosphodiesterase class I)
MMAKKENPLFEMIPPDVLHKAKLLSDECLMEAEVDRSFVHNVTPDSGAAKLLGSVIALGHQLGLAVVAEGAETHAEWKMLEAFGADMVQG